MYMYMFAICPPGPRPPPCSSFACAHATHPHASTCAPACARPGGIASQHPLARARASASMRA